MRMERVVMKRVVMKRGGKRGLLHEVVGRKNQAAGRRKRKKRKNFLHNFLRNFLRFFPVEHVGWPLEDSIRFQSH